METNRLPGVSSIWASEMCGTELPILLLVLDVLVLKCEFVQFMVFV
jgi:hypothetical protein